MSDDELLQFTERKNMYACFIYKYDTSDIFSDVESSGGSDSETLAEECERKDDVLFSSIVLILSFVMTYKLTHARSFS